MNSGGQVFEIPPQQVRISWSESIEPGPVTSAQRPYKDFYQMSWGPWKLGKPEDRGPLLNGAVESITVIDLIKAIKMYDL